MMPALLLSISSIRARNCLISNCGQNVVLAKGGDYQFTHCTVATFSNSYILHRDPVLYVSNYVLVNNVPVQTAPLNALFRNCIFWGQDGTVEDEVVVAKSGSTTFNVNFDYDLWKVQKTDPCQYYFCWNNQLTNIRHLIDI